MYKCTNFFICVQEVSPSQSSLQSQNANKSQNAALSQDWITKKLISKSDGDNLKSTQNVENVDKLITSSQVLAINEAFPSTEDVAKQSNIDYVAATYDDNPTFNKVNFASLLLTEEADDDDMNDFLLPTQEDNKVESSNQMDDVVKESTPVPDVGKLPTQNPVEHDAQDFDHFEVSC